MRTQGHNLNLKERKFARESLLGLVEKGYEGRQAPLARAMKVSPQVLGWWIKSGIVPPTQVKVLVYLSKGTGAKITPMGLRPDVFSEYKPKVRSR